MKYEGLKVGQSIRKLRKKHDMSMADFSEEVGVTISHLTQIELGYRKMSMDVFFRIMDVLEEDANTVLGMSEEIIEDSDFSIDECLRELPEEQKKYLVELFVFMIDNLPVKGSE